MTPGSSHMRRRPSGGTGRPTGSPSRC
jgi:hypothetical protein